MVRLKVSLEEEKAFFKIKELLPPESYKRSYISRTGHKDEMQLHFGPNVYEKMMLSKFIFKYMRPGLFPNFSALFEPINIFSITATTSTGESCRRLTYIKKDITLLELLNKIYAYLALKNI